MFKYVESVQGKASNRGNIIKITSSNIDIDCYGTDMVDSYHSIFKFPEELTEIAGYKGKVSIDCLYWDMDHELLEQAYMDTGSLVQRLININVDSKSIRIYFSGNKGFHVLLPSIDIQELGGREDMPRIVKDICNTLAYGLESFDSVIYDKTRIFRTSNSKHSITKLYKIGLTIDEFTSMDISDIKEIARYQKSPPKWGEAVSNNKINELIKESLAGRLKTMSNAAGKFTYSELEHGMQDGFAKGKRNSGLTSVAGVLHRKGIGKNFIASILHAINDRAVEPLDTKSIEIIINSVCSYPVDQQYTELSDRDIITVGDAGKRWKELRTKCGKLNTGFTHIDRGITFFDPGQVLVIAGRGGVGKTTLAMQFANGLATSLNGRALFVSLEMPTPSLFFRAATISTNKSADVEMATNKIIEQLLKDDKNIIDVSKYWERVLLVDKDSLSLEQIEQCFNIAENKYHNIDVICIDYGGLISGATDYNQTSAIARGVKALAKRLKTRVILVLQMSRAAGDGTTPVKMHHLRDTGAWEEAADYILGGWISEIDPNRIHMCVLKNRFGERNIMFDIINKGLSYSTVNTKYDTKEGW